MINIKLDISLSAGSAENCWFHLSRMLRLPNESLGYDSKWSDGEAPV